MGQFVEDLEYEIKYIYFSGLGQKDVYAILWYEIDLTHRVSQASLSHVSYASFYFMTAATICSDFGAPQN